MNVKITSVHFDADKKLEDFITKKVNKVIQKHDNIIDVNVILQLEKSQEKTNKITEIKVNTKGNDFFVKKQTSSFEASTDEAIDALKKQLDKYKEKLIGR